MWCFSCFKLDPSQDEVENVMASSRHVEEDRKARLQMEKDKQVEIEKAMEESLKLAKEEETKRRILEKSKEKGKRKQVEEVKAQIRHSKDHVKEEDMTPPPPPPPPPPPSICNGCNSAIEDGISVNAFGVLWHPLCLRCLHCHNPIAINEIYESKGQFHRPCYREHRHPKCYVCDKKIPLTAKRIEYKEHLFWKDKYCPSHDNDGTAKCCSCERLESFGTKYVMLGDGRWLCRECMECAIMDTDECNQLHIEICDFFDSLNFKVEKKFPILLVEKEALNKAEEVEKIDNQSGMVTRGICLSEEQTVSSVLKGPRMGPNNQLIIDIVPKSQMVHRKCEVTAILILYGLPRFLTGNILAHEMMHAWLRLNGYRKLNDVLEEGICQVLAHMWLEPQTYVTTAARVDASLASSSSRTPPATTTSKKGDPSVFEKKLVEFFKYQIESDNSTEYGLGFHQVKEMMESNDNNLKDTLKDIVSISKTTPYSKF